MMLLSGPSTRAIGVLEESKRAHELKKQIEWSRRWTPTYLLLLAAIILSLACYRRLYSWIDYRKRRTRFGYNPRHSADLLIDDCAGEGTSSSSSTLNEQSCISHGPDPSAPKPFGDLGAAKNGTSEQTPLLPSSFRGSRRRFRPWQIWKSFLMYQPRPTLAITASRNILPPNSRTLILLLWLIPNLFYLFFRTPISLPSIIILGDRAGLCFAVNLPVLYLLGAKNQTLRLLIGRSYEDLNIFHRRLGEWMIILATIHGVCMIAFFWPLFHMAGRSLAWFLSERIILLGILTFASYLTIYITSIGYVRQLYYEAFLVIHVVVQIGALALLFFHHSGSRPYVVAALCIWAIDRILMRILVVPVTVKAEATLSDDEDTVLLSAKIPIHDHKSWRWLLRPNVCSGWQPGQHIFISVPSLNPNAVIQAHPYSIASTPDINLPNAEEPASRSLSLIIRAKDGFTLDLLNHLKAEQEARSTSHPVLHDLQVRIDGPYGSADTFEAVSNADRKLFIAAGSGVAATFPMATTAAGLSPITPPGSHEDASKQRGDHLAHYWIVRTTTHRSWLPGGFQSPGYPTVIPPEGTENSILAIAGDKAATRESLLDEAVSWIERHGSVEQAAKIAVVISGPDAMVRGIRNRCARLVRHGWDVDVFVEKFGW